MIAFIGKLLATVSVAISSIFIGQAAVSVQSVATTTTPIIIVATTTVQASSTIQSPVTDKPKSTVAQTIKALITTASSVSTPVTTTVTPAASATSPAGSIACNGSFWKTQLACPSGKELVCPSSGDPICQWTASSSAAIAAQQAYTAKQQADAEAQEQQEAENAAQSKITATESYVVADEIAMRTDCSTDISDAACENDLNNLGVDAKQELVVGIPSTDKADQLDLITQEYTELRNDYASLVSSTGMSRAVLAQDESARSDELQILSTDEALF